MTVEELKKHCEKQINLCSRLNDYKHLEEHQLILNLIEENKQLKLINKEYERLNKENGRGFKITSIKQYNIKELVRYKDNWKKLKGYVKDNLYFYRVFQGEDLEIEIAIQDVLSKMKELEQGSDSNE